MHWFSNMEPEHLHDIGAQYILHVFKSDCPNQGCSQKIMKVGGMRNERYAVP